MPKVDHKIFEYNKITSQIWLGTNWCCRVHFDRKLTKLGIRADISLEKQRLDAPWGIDYFLWLPTKDHAAPPLIKLKIGARTIQELIESGIKIYIHCKNGHGRAPTMLAAYFILKGATAHEAIAQIKKKRPEIHIEPSQKKRLEQFARRVKTQTHLHPN